MELSEDAMRAEIQKLGVAPIDGTAPLSSCVEQLLSAFEGMRSQVAASRSKWDEMMGALSEVSEQAQSLKKQVEAQSLKKQAEEAVKKQVEAQSMKKQVEAQSMKKQVEAQSMKKQAEEAVKDSDQQDSVKEAEVSEGCSHVKEMQEMIVEALEQ